MGRPALILAALIVGLVLLVNLAAGWAILPPLLLAAPLPARTEAQRAALRARLLPPGCAWTQEQVVGGEGVPLQVWRLRRPGARGVAILLHGFGDDAWGAAPRLQDLPALDAVVFTFRNRDLEPRTPSTLGGWEGEDVVAVVAHLAAQGVPRDRILLVGASQGAGVALLALGKLERNGGAPLAGALLEAPYASLEAAARDHLRGALGRAEWLLRPGERLALARAGRLASFEPASVSPLEAARLVRTRIALLSGDTDDVTPIAGVRAIALSHPDLTIVRGAGHLEAGARVQGGWRSWAWPRLAAWGLGQGD